MRYRHRETPHAAGVSRVLEDRAIARYVSAWSRVVLYNDYHPKTDEKNVLVLCRVHDYGTMENCVTYRVSVFGS